MGMKAVSIRSICPAIIVVGIFTVKQWLSAMQKRSKRTFLKMPQLTRKTSDKFDLYQRSVQAAETVQFLQKRFHILTGHPARSFREDFSGTAFNCCEFVKLHPNYRAVAIDLDESALRWCLENNYRELTESQWSQVTLIHGNVLSVKTPRVDLIAVLNLSYAVFKVRSDLLRYLKRSRKSLLKDGAIILDAVTGTDIFGGFTYSGKCEGFTCVSEWRPLNPLNHEYEIRLSFVFPDGSRIRDAFIYYFRWWTLPELQEILSEAGYKNIHVIWGFPGRKIGEEVDFRRTLHPRFNGSGLVHAFVVGQAN